MIPIYKNEALKEGQVIASYRGKDWIFKAVSAYPSPGKSGKVLVTAVGSTKGFRQFYDRVFNITWREA